jgi:light-regulated signal transduction histidine kinase (bacteriophytochrome)
LQNLNHELEAFSYSVSHDLKAPVRAIQGFTTILKEDYYHLLDAEGQELLQDIVDETRRMAQIIEALLQLSRTGRKSLNYVKFDMEPLVRSVFMEQQKHHKLMHARLEITELPVVVADYSLIKQLLSNLLSNALKYSSKRKQPVVKMGMQKNEENGEPVIFVKDNGAGFRPDASAKMFDAFVRLHSGKLFEGTGIGLAIAKRIVTRHGGKIWAESKPDQGATFYFTLPSK